LLALVATGALGSKFVMIDPPVLSNSGSRAPTGRQREVMFLVAQGLSNKQIGRKLNITEGTVKLHLHEIYVRVGVRNRTVLAGQLIKTNAARFSRDGNDSTSGREESNRTSKDYG